MNNDLISREYLEDAFDNLCCHNCKICRNFRNEDSFYKCALIDNAPTVELLMGRMTNGVIIPIEKSEGEWIQDELHNVVCSNCGGIRRDNRVDYINYCNKCGAKMVKGER